MQVFSHLFLSPSLAAVPPRSFVTINDDQTSGKWKCTQSSSSTTFSDEKILISNVQDCAVTSHVRCSCDRFATLLTSRQRLTADEEWKTRSVAICHFIAEKQSVSVSLSRVSCAASVFSAHRSRGTASCSAAPSYGLMLCSVVLRRHTGSVVRCDLAPPFRSACSAVSYRRTGTLHRGRRRSSTASSAAAFRRGFSGDLLAARPKCATLDACG